MAAGATLTIKVTPRASKNAVDGWRNGQLIVRVTAAPVDAAANDAVIALFAGALRIPKRDITIVRGASSRTKVLAFAHLAPDALTARFSP